MTKGAGVGRASNQTADETGTPDVVPEETDNGPKPGDGAIPDQSDVALPPPPVGRRRVTGVAPGQVLKAAASSLGTTENPAGSNCQPFGAAYGMDGVAWCNIFVSQVGHQVTGDYDLLGRFAYTPSCAAWWNAQGRFGREPEPGAVVFFDWSGSQSIQAIDHVGIVVEPLDNGLVRTIEGNSAVPGHPDGVWYHDRNPGFIVGYGYPAYGGTSPGPVLPDDVFRPYRAVAAGSRELRVLDTGDDVKELQRRLHLGVDGEFGAITKNAVMRFQRVNHLALDGVVGPRTWSALLRTVIPGPVVPPFPGELRRGSTGRAVRQLQQRLKDRGWRLGVDGDFGPTTEGVVRSFQKEKGLSVDGVVGTRTWSAVWQAPVT